MVTAASKSVSDPLGSFIYGAVVSGTQHPVPLVATRFDITIQGGLASVNATRLFRNSEESPIEATITLPVPIHATMFSLQARIGDRILKGHVELRRQARATYEDAIDGGKTTVLHEEVLRGIHMLSVGNIPPGAEIEITTAWAVTLAQLEGRWQLRIPQTVGDVYGRSPLSDSDDLVHGGPVQMAEVQVNCPEGTVELIGGRLEGGHAMVPTSVPIDLVVARQSTSPVFGQMADGRVVEIRIEPQPRGEASLDLAILVDHSGSMSEVCAGGDAIPPISKHSAITNALRIAAKAVNNSDKIDLWEFDNTARRVGSVPIDGEVGPPALLSLLERLSAPAGGTEIGSAILQVLKTSLVRDVILITDGKSHSLDVQALATSGRRFTVVLVGEDSLEANVGHLAALTGGQIFVVAGTDATVALLTALSSLRSPSQVLMPCMGELERVTALRSGARISAHWTAVANPVDSGPVSKAVVAVAASLAMAILDQDRAAVLAQAEGLVSHLTSLVLVDAEATPPEGLPMVRKVHLPSPRTQVGFRLFLAEDSARVSASVARVSDIFGELSLHKSIPQMEFSMQAALTGIASTLSWDLAAGDLLEGNLSKLTPSAVDVIRETARLPGIVAVAQSLNVESIVLVLALLALVRAQTDRSAARFARKILGSKPSVKIRVLMSTLGLKPIETGTN